MKVVRESIVAAILTPIIVSSNRVNITDATANNLGSASAAISGIMSFEMRKGHGPETAWLLGRVGEAAEGKATEKVHSIVQGE